jgi:hypothetical protein
MKKSFPFYPIFTQSMVMRRILLWIFIAILASCSDKPVDINTDENIDVEDFIQSFPLKELPIAYTQANVTAMETDSLLIKESVVYSFVPDSIFNKEFGNAKQISFHRSARYKAEESEETYLFLKAERKTKKLIYLICFNKENVFSAAMELLGKDADPRTVSEAAVDKRLTIIKNRTKQTGDGKYYYNKSAYVYNTEGLFTLILTESNEPVEDKVIFNPIDTLPKKSVFAGDFKKDKKNFVSIRDGSKPNKLNFFIHIENSGNECEGSLRGDLEQVKPKVFHYNKADDHCILEFTFQGKQVQVKELEACGNHRGVRCSFDGRYRK